MIWILWPLMPPDAFSFAAAASAPTAMSGNWKDGALSWPATMTVTGELEPVDELADVGADELLHAAMLRTVTTHPASASDVLTRPFGMRAPRLVRCHGQADYG
jgi:hypothetical protein